MKVSVIIAKKGSHAVATIAPERTLADAAEMLSQLGIGCLIVSRDGQRPDGVLSERDIVRRLGTDGADILTQTAEETMTSPVECCVAEDTADDVLARMTDGRFRHMPVLGPDDAMTGLLSIGDVVKARLEEIETENAQMLEMIHS